MCGIRTWGWCQVMSMADRVGFRCYHDCETEENVLICTTWAHHVTLTAVVGFGSGTSNLDRDGVLQLIAQLQEWVERG